MPAIAEAQRESVKPGINKNFEDPDVEDWIAKFEREGRDVYDHRQEILKACQLRKGMAVADVGAGTGLFTELFARRVGPDGTVVAVDIAESFVQHIKDNCRKKNLNNVVGVVCTPKSTKLPPDSVDLAYICDTYHHFEFPQDTMRSLHAALKAGGRLVLIDFKRVEGVSPEWILGHVRAGKETFIQEVESAGFKLIDQNEDLLKDSYLLRFEKVAASES
jgi:predicted methyltransferase